MGLKRYKIRYKDDGEICEIDQWDLDEERKNASRERRPMMFTIIQEIKEGSE